MKQFVSFLLILICSFGFSQMDSLFIKRELQLKSYLDQLRLAKTNTEKDEANQQFKTYLFETIQLKGAFEYPFASLKTLGTIKSPDNSFRLFNWNVEQDDQSNLYYCYILRLDEKKKEWKIIELKDQSAILPPQPEDVLTEENWYGALYYKIIPVEKTNRTYYTILGWDGSSSSTNTKLIDVLTFNGAHIKLGSPIFKTKEGVHKRLFFEHSKRAFMSLNYDEDRKRIIFDHLSPETANLEGFREFYVPDFSYDELKFSNNKWQLREDVIGLNAATNKTHKISYANPKKGAKPEIVEKEVKTKWIDPSNPNAPNGGNVHVAQLPEEDVKEIKKNQKTSSPDLKPKILTKKAKKNEFSLNPYLKGKNK